MRKKLYKIAQMASLLLALAFTISCSDDNGDGGDSSGDGGDNISNYSTESIGSQVWITNNLNYDVSGSKCYNDDPTNCAKYGRLYDWATAMALSPSCNSTSCLNQIRPKHKGICPNGWHIPSDADWTTLTDFGGGSLTAGRKLKATSDWNEGGNGTNDYGFLALPGGFCKEDGRFSNLGDYGRWWSATEEDAYRASYRGMVYDNENVIEESYYKNRFFSVRCVKD